MTVRSSTKEIVKIPRKLYFLSSSRVWDLFYEMCHLKLPTSESHNAFNRMHAGDKVRGLLPDHLIVLAVLRKLC